MQIPIQTVAGGVNLSTMFAVPLHLAVMIFLVGVATFIDLRERRIPNWLVVTGMATGLLFHLLMSNGQGVIFALSGVAVGIGVLFPLYVMRAMGAGDVKLMGMIGTFVGASSVLGVLLATLAAGGVLALCMAAGKRMLPQLLVNLRTMLIRRHIQQLGGGVASSSPDIESVGKMPYAVAILAGTLIQLFVLRY